LDDVRYSVLSVKAIWWAAGLIVLVGVGVAVWLLLAFGGGGEQQRNQLEAIKAAGTIVVGTGGGAALLLAARRLRTAEIALKQKNRDQADAALAHALRERIAAQTQVHQERVAAATEADATGRRITELYTKAIEQLGSDKSPVRLGGLYALERLAQDNPSQRQTIVNVLCAYLRMPYELPGDVPADVADERTVTTFRERVQEREVRRTAQRLLAEHLRSRALSSAAGIAFWHDIDLDLTGAVLNNFSLADCTVRTARFVSATFTGISNFTSASFCDDANFESATFTGWATFRSATFNRFAHFESATFTDSADFALAIFSRYAHFQSATFSDYATFRYTTFPGSADFSSTKFASEVPKEVVRYGRPIKSTDQRPSGS
jgi:pentapeptide repeat protein